MKFPIESLSKSLLLVSPFITSSDNEIVLQSFQTLVELIDLYKASHKTFDLSSATSSVKIELSLKIIQIGQLLLEMTDKTKNAPLRIELVKLILSIFLLAHKNELRKTKLNGFLRLVAPVIYVYFRSKNQNNRGFVMFLILNLLALSLTEDRLEFEDVKKDVFNDCLIKKPVFDNTIRKPLEIVSKIWNKIPILRSLNYLDYYITFNDKYYYYFEGK
jgi:hypothetical protein